MKRLLLIRHGQTDWNVEGRWQGHLDQPLNATGLEQARELGQYLSTRPISAVYSSDLARARVTAEQIAGRHGLTVNSDVRWREQDLGVFQGMTTSEISVKYPEDLRQLRENYLDFAPPKAETRRAMQERALAAYTDVLNREPGEQIAIVSHGGTIRVLLYKFFGEDILHRSVQNTSISIIETDGKTQRLVETAITPHLIE